MLNSNLLPVFLFMLGLACLPIYAQYSGGTGTPEDPYQIATAQDLVDLGNNSGDHYKHFILAANVDLSGYVFEGAVIDRFFGSLDGTGHKVSNLAITGEGSLALIGEVASQGKVSNLGIVDVNVFGTDSTIGGLVAQNRGTVFNCYSNGSVEGERFIGGLVGLNYGDITTCYSTGSAAGVRDVGGLVGFSRGNITTSYSTGSVTGEENVGGLMGYAYGSVTSSYSEANVLGIKSAGGLVGYLAGSITACYSTGSVEGEVEIGGLVGWSFSSWGSVASSYSTGLVTGERDVGGLVGGNGGHKVTSSFWDTERSSQFKSAGGTGLTTAEMQDTKIFPSISGWDFVGEIAYGTGDYWQMTPRHYPTLNYLPDEVPVMPEGLGTVEEPYLIRDARDLGTVWLEHWAHYRLEASLDLSGIKWSMAPIPSFGGSFDGNGHVINSLQIEGGTYLGLFGKLDSRANLSNLSLEAVAVSGTGYFIGGLVGRNEGDITWCNSIGVVTGGTYVGGLVGKHQWFGNISSCYSAGTVDGDGDVGGLVGQNSSSITTSYSECSVTGDRHVGGLVGSNGGDITTSFSTGLVTGERDVGGLVGINWEVITSCYSIGYVTGNDGSVGGLVGENSHFRSDITSSFWDTETSGQSTSPGGTGLPTIEMQDINTFLDAGWEFVGDPASGKHNNWQILPGDYPRLRIAKWEGWGRPEEPYQIATAQDLIDLGNNPNNYDKHFILTADIDLSEYEFTQAVIAPDTEPNGFFQGTGFSGSFDGNGYTISNLTAIEDFGDSYFALFGRVESQGKVSNLGIVDVNVTSNGIIVGGLVGENRGSVLNCYSTGSVEGERIVGGLVGWNNGDITACYSTLIAAGVRNIGGLVGQNHGHITASYSTGSVTGDQYVGGLVGVNYGDITTCYSAATVEGEKFVGGLMGGFGGRGVTLSFWDTETSGQSTSAGGMGRTTAEMQDINTFLEAGWDIADVTENNTENIWWIEDQAYPRLWWELIP